MGLTDVLFGRKKLKEAAKEHLEVSEVTGQEIQEIIAHAYSLPPEVIAAANEATSMTGAPRELKK